MQLILLPQTAPLPTLPIEDIDRAANLLAWIRPNRPERPTGATLGFSPPGGASKGVSSLPAAPATLAAFWRMRQSAAWPPARSAAATLRSDCSQAFRTRTTQHTESVKATVRGDQARHRRQPANRKSPAIAETMHKISKTMGLGVKDIRDRALLLLGFGGAFRRSELVALNV